MLLIVVFIVSPSVQYIPNAVKSKGQTRPLTALVAFLYGLSRAHHSQLMSLSQMPTRRRRPCMCNFNGKGQKSECLTNKLGIVELCDYARA